MDDLIGLIQVWSIDKGLDEADSFKQLAKFLEEAGEIASALVRQDESEFKDAIGDTIVTLIILAQQQGMDIQDCLQEAYDVISKRTGKTVGGVFIKSEDLQGEQ